MLLVAKYRLFNNYRKNTHQNVSASVKPWDHSRDAAHCLKDSFPHQQAAAILTSLEVMVTVSKEILLCGAFLWDKKWRDGNKGHGVERNLGILSSSCPSEKK